MRIYDEPTYAHSRLQGTVVRLNGRAIKVSMIEPNGETHYRLLYNGDDGHCMLKDLDIDPVPLGYINVRGLAMYLVRMPMRQDWKQGLRENNLRTIDGLKPMIQFGPELARTIEGVYPSIGESINLLKKNRASVAFSRNFSIRNDFSIEYKGRFTIGLFNSNHFSLNNEYDWLSDVFEDEVMNARA